MTFLTDLADKLESISARADVKGTKTILELAPGADNPRNSEGAFVTLRDGKILFAYSRYHGSSHDDGASADVYGMISDDNGKTFSKPYLILSNEQHRAQNFMSVSFLRKENGDLALITLRKDEGLQCRPFIMTSADEGMTWSELAPCIQTAGYFVLNNDRVVRLKSGRILLPTSYIRTNNVFDGNGKLVKSAWKPCRAVVYASDDDGQSWYELGAGVDMPYLNGDRSSGLQEPGVLQLNNGVVWMFFRTDLGRIYESFSLDDGYTWTPVQPSKFTSAISPISIKRLSGGDILAVWNPVPVYNGRSEVVDGTWTGGRTPLVVAISHDDGKTFSSPTTIESDPRSGYAYTAIHELSDGSVLLGYCAGSVKDKCMLNRLRIKKLSPEFIQGL